MKSIRVVAAIMILGCLLPDTPIIMSGLPGPLPVPEVLAGSGYAHAEEAWLEEFNDVCSRTDIAMDLSREELGALVARCDKLKPLIEGLDESRRKVYLSRLKACRDLYKFMLETEAKK